MLAAPCNTLPTLVERFVVTPERLAAILSGGTRALPREHRPDGVFSTVLQRLSDLAGFTSAQTIDVDRGPITYLEMRRTDHDNE